MDRNPKTWIGISAALAATMLVGPTATAKTLGERAFRFEVRALGGRVGEAILTIGRPREIAGRRLRPVQIAARTEGLGAAVYKADTTSTTWVDEAWMPIRARWDANTPKGKRMVKARYDGRHIHGEDYRNGKLRRKLVRKLPERPSDMVSAFAWLMHGDLTPGAKDRRTVYSGTFLYEVTSVVGELEEIHVPLGLRRAVPIKVRIRRGPKYERWLTYWIEPDTRTPVKVSFQYGALGSVDAVLIGKKGR